VKKFYGLPLELVLYDSAESEIEGAWLELSSAGVSFFYCYLFFCFNSIP
jgi:hypothetical protein